MIRSNKGLSIKLYPFSITGLPDRLNLLPGGVIFFTEIKTKGKSLSKTQVRIKVKIQKLGFKYYVVDSIDKIEWIKKIYGTTKKE